MQQALRYIVLISLVGISACDSKDNNKYRIDLSDADAINLSEKMNLKDRYRYYEIMYDSSVPANTILADSVALYNESAWELAVSKVREGSGRDLMRALPIISSVRHKIGRKCNPSEINILKNSARSYLRDDQGYKYLIDNISVSCGLSRNEKYNF